MQIKGQLTRSVQFLTWYLPVNTGMSETMSISRNYVIKGHVFLNFRYLNRCLHGELPRIQ